MELNDQIQPSEKPIHTLGIRGGRYCQFILFEDRETMLSVVEANQPGMEVIMDGWPHFEGIFLAGVICPQRYHDAGWPVCSQVCQGAAIQAQPSPEARSPAEQP
ncbi:MAG: hypothetical protein IKE04_05470 [Oscillospiraceae bacterium]|nr:hypothetical protein [Oscillospiraceae bacterium]